MRTRLATLIAAASMLAAASAQKPTAVSLDYCADQYLLKLAAPDQIAALSKGAERDFSYMRAAAAPYHKIRPNAEEALVLQPDVVLRHWGGGPRAQAILKRFDAKVVSLTYAQDFDGVIANIRRAAQALDQHARGQALIAEMTQRRTALANRAAKHNFTEKERALYVTPGAVTAGAQTMINEIMQAANIRNITAEEGKQYWPALSPESLLLDPPDIIIAGFFTADDEAINHWSLAKHPAIARLLEEKTTIYLPTDQISCPGWFALDAAEQIAERLERRRSAHQ